MKITKSQMNAPFVSNPNEMRAAILKWWLEADPNILMDYSFDLLQEMAESARLFAFHYDIYCQPEVCALANLMWLYGPNLDDERTVVRILGADITPEEKIEALYTKVPDRDWEKIAAHRDEAQWVDIQFRLSEA